MKTRFRAAGVAAGPFHICCIIWVDSLRGGLEQDKYEPDEKAVWRAYIPELEHKGARLGIYRERGFREFRKCC